MCSGVLRASPDSYCSWTAAFSPGENLREKKTVQLQSTARESESKVVLQNRDSGELRSTEREQVSQSRPAESSQQTWRYLFVVLALQVTKMTFTLVSSREAQQWQRTCSGAVFDGDVDSAYPKPCVHGAPDALLILSAGRAFDYKYYSSTMSEIASQVRSALC